jgi:lipid-A-disaccharide synthase
VKPLRIMLVAGEASGDALAADLVGALRRGLMEQWGQPTNDLQPRFTGVAPEFFGAGGPGMAAAGVELVADTTVHAVVGLSEVVRELGTYWRLFRRLLALAVTRQPDLILLVDSSGFNLRLAASLRRRVRSQRGTFGNWSPKIVYYVSPQVWASRPGRVFGRARDLDLVLSIFPFEREWYAERAPGLRVEFVGHPMVERHGLRPGVRGKPAGAEARSIPSVLLLPGSRTQELRRHLPVMVDALRTLVLKRSVRGRLVVPNERLLMESRQYTAGVGGLETRVGGLGEALAEADVALACSGTVTLECAFYGVPTVVMYRASWPTYLVARRLVQVKYLAMPNLLAGERVYPEFIQSAVTAENVAREALDLLMNVERRAWIQEKLKGVVESLGTPGASQRAAEVLTRLLVRGRPELRSGLRD